MCFDCFKRSKETETNLNLYYCFDCKIYFNKQKQYDKHMKKIHNKKYDKI